MFKKEKITKSEIIWMVWGYFGSCIIGSLLILADLRYLTGFNFKVVDNIGTGLFAFGVFFIIFLFAVFIYRISFNKSKVKNKFGGKYH